MPRSPRPPRPRDDAATDRRLAAAGAGLLAVAAAALALWSGTAEGRTLPVGSAIIPAERWPP